MIRKRVSVIVETSKGILLVKPYFPPRYVLPGGGLKKGESLVDAGRRELLEETGLSCKKIKHLFDLEMFYQKHFVFLAETRGEIKLNWENRGHVFLKGFSNDLGMSKGTRLILEKFWNRKGF